MFFDENSMSRTWQLEDVSDRAIDAKYTFYLPSKEALALLNVGDIVKLVFLCDVENDKGWSAERMWVQITNVKPHSFEGHLDNDPYYIPDIVAGDLVRFEPKHIIQISIDDPMPNAVDQYSSMCYVSGSILYDGKKVTRLFRESPTKDEDNYSGWTFFSMGDSEEYLNDSESWYYVSLGAVLNKDDKVIGLLESDYESEFIWNNSKNRFEAV